MPGRIHFEAFVAAPLEVVWRAFQLPSVLKRSDRVSDGWLTDSVTVDLRVGGKKYCMLKHIRYKNYVLTTLTYDRVEPMSLISGCQENGTRKVTEFLARNGGVFIRQIYDAMRHPRNYTVRMQKEYYQACLDNFARYVSEQWRQWNVQHHSRGHHAGYDDFIRRLAQ
ncbi:hypothetical protein GGR57DRAFT_308867 [Xylariaceae sp. FL1272]|nr:hypothetical protein GGR57DRAFT_308867 [Xylariaceae sp. FL1272]